MCTVLTSGPTGVAVVTVTRATVIGVPDETVSSRLLVS